MQPCFNLKPKQIKCLELILNGHDVIGVLPTGFGKSFLFQVLPDLIPCKSKMNIVVVVCPLNSIIEDQLLDLSDIGISASILHLHIEKVIRSPNFFGDEKLVSDDKLIPENIVNGQCKLVFCHPEAILSPEGHKLMVSRIYEENVVACVIDEAHCIEIWGKEFRTDFSNLSASS